MSIKHMPYGMHENENCGFGRLPVAPLAGETVTIFARLDAQNTNAVLQWTVDGTSQCDIQAAMTKRPHDNQPYAEFTLQMPESLCVISYRICTEDDQTGWYYFDTLQSRTLDEKHLVFCDDACVVMVNEDVSLSLLWKSGQLQVYAGDLRTKKITNSCQQNFFNMVKRFTFGKGSLLPTIHILYDKQGNIHEVTLVCQLAGQRVYGLGERFDGVNQQDKALVLRVEEYFGTQEDHSYLPVSMLMTEAGIGLYNDNLRTTQMSFCKAKNGTIVTLRQQTAQTGLLFTLHLLHGTPVRMLQQYHAATGQPALPPKWALGIWMSANGWNSQRETLHQLAMCRQHDLPATALVLEAWSDEKTFYLWNDAQYSLQDGEKQYTLQDMCFPEDGLWPDPAAMIREFQAAGIQTVLWQIPVIKHAFEGSIPQLDADEQYVIKKGYCIHQADGTPYRISDGWFSGSLLLDFTNEDARAWWFGKRQYLLDMGVAGFKTDGGEFLFDAEALLQNGMRGDEAHNAYPLQYIRAYNQFAGVTFSRAGYAGAQTMPIHWAGDQLSTWEALRAQVSAGLSAGLSGIAFWSFDLAGFAGPLPSAELYLRALAVAAFCPVMQWHSEPRNGQYDFTAGSEELNDRSPWNIAARTGDARVLSAYRRLAKLRMRLLDVLYEEAHFATASSRPLMAHLIIDYPDDPMVWDIEDEYMLGRDLLVAPVLWENEAGRRVYLPAGEWTELFTGVQYAGCQWTTCACPAGEVLVFARNHVALMQSLFQEE